MGLSKDQLVKILRSEELRIEDEYQVFTAAMDWVLHDVPKRKKHIVEVLEPVRFPLLSPQRLFKYIESKENSYTSSFPYLIYLPYLLYLFTCSATLRVADVLQFNCFLFCKGITDFSLRVALQTLLKEYTEVTKSPKENKTYSQLQPSKMRPRRKARKYLYAIGCVLEVI